MGPNNTIWSPGVQEGEFNAGISTGLVDSLGTQLVDSSGTTLADDGTTYTPVAQTTWSINETG